MTENYFAQYRNLDTHWYRCSCCGGTSWDSDTAALAGKADLGPADIRHDTNCPGRVFPDKYSERITRLY